MFEILIYSVCAAALIIGSLTDIKTREVPDWLNFFIISAGFGIRSIYSAALLDWSYIMHGIYGFIIVLIIANLMFYAGQWGGGDSKMLMGLGVLLGFNFSMDSMLVSFLVNILIFGAIYGLLWTFFISIRNWNNFSAKFRKLMKKDNYILIRIVLISISFVLIISFIFLKDVPTRISLAMLFCVLWLTFYLWVAVKAVEHAYMYKYVSPKQLTEGDWIVKNVKVDGKHICGPKDLGIEIPQIKKLIQLEKMGKIKKILIKEGIPFVPSFLISFTFSIIYGNIIFLVLSI